jgi:hypothetical protein
MRSRTIAEDEILGKDKGGKDKGVRKDKGEKR